MNLKKILEMQKPLDDSIVKVHNVKPEEIRIKRIVALLVEIGEFANEYAPFKYWKKNKDINRANVIEEFVDGIHFFASLALELNFEKEITPQIISQDQSKQLAHTFKLICNLIKDFNSDTLEKAFRAYLGNAKLLEITDAEIEEFYIFKNKINHKRIKNNY